MLDYAFSQFRTHKLYDRDHILADVAVSKGDKDKIPVMTSESVSLLTKKGEKMDDVVERLDIDADLRAPIKKGDTIGALIVEKNGETLLSSPLIAGDDVFEASWWKMFKRVLSKFGAA